jgi:hypothetical protein
MYSSHGLLESMPADFLNLKINQDSTTELQNEEQIAVNPLDGQNVVAVWRDFRLGFRQVGVGASFDGGLTWTEDLMVDPRFTRQSDPGLTYDKDGNFYAVLLSYEAIWDSNSLAVLKSTDGGLSWGAPSYAVVSGPAFFEDKELMSCDRTSNPTGGNLYISWTRFDQSNNTDIMLVRSTDGGNNWASPVQVSDNGGVQWSVPVVGSNGEVYIAWVDYGSANILIDKSTDGGMTFGADIPVAPVNYQGNINGGILVFPFPALDADITGGLFNGNLYVAYMWDSGTDMDILFRRSTDQGMTWSSSQRICDDAIGNGADQFHPWLTVDQNGTITVVFYDRRNDPSNLLFDIYMTQSFDGGNTFTPNERISNVSSVPLSGKSHDPESAPSNSNRENLLPQLQQGFFSPHPAGLIGEYIGVASYYGELHPVWTDTRNGHQDVYTAVDTSQIRDVGVLSILSPADTVYCGMDTPLGATVCNSGNRTESFDVISQIDSSGVKIYGDTVKVLGLEADSCVTINFDDWTVPDRDNVCYTYTVYTWHPIDGISGNDTLSKVFCASCVEILDAGILSIDYPDTVPCDTTLIIPVTVCNFGDSTKTFPVEGYFLCNSYFDSLTIIVDSLSPDSCTIVNFQFDPGTAWPDSECCDFTVHTSLANDMNPVNDTLNKEVCFLCPVGVEENNSSFRIPTSEFKLLQNTPNPFSQLTAISYQLRAPSHTTLKIYDMTGKSVRSLVNENQEEGQYTVRWDGRNENGKKVSSGVYFYKLKAERFEETKKIILFR